MSKIIISDFDGTITSVNNFPDMPPPHAGVKEAFQKLKENGYEIHIVSCRTNRDLYKHPIDRRMQVRDMEEYLDKYKIPYDEVLDNDKPIAVWYIDDRGIGFRGNWEDVVVEILGEI